MYANTVGRDQQTTDEESNNTINIASPWNFRTTPNSTATPKNVFWHFLATPKLHTSCELVTINWSVYTFLLPISSLSHCGIQASTEEVVESSVTATAEEVFTESSVHIDTHSLHQAKEGSDQKIPAEETHPTSKQRILQKQKEMVGSTTVLHWR